MWLKFVTQLDIFDAGIQFSSANTYFELEVLLHHAGKGVDCDNYFH